MNTIDLYGADWCPDCQRAKAYLKEHRVDFNFIDVDLDKDATAVALATASQEREKRTAYEGKKEQRPVCKAKKNWRRNPRRCKSWRQYRRTSCGSEVIGQLCTPMVQKTM